MLERCHQRHGDVCEALTPWVSDSGNACSLSSHFSFLVRAKLVRSRTHLRSATSWALKLLRNLLLFTQTAKWRQLSAMPTSSRCLLGIMKMCSLCRLCGVAPALCPAWPGQVRLTTCDPRNYRIAESTILWKHWPAKEQLHTVTVFLKHEILHCVGTRERCNKKKLKA